MPVNSAVVPVRRHSYALIDGAEHVLELASAFVTAGIEGSERVTLIGVTDPLAGSLLTRLREDGTDPDRALRDGQLVIDQSGTDEFYAMTPQRLTEVVSRQTAAAARDGYCGIRFASLLLGVGISPHERTLSQLVREHPVTVLCCYHSQATAEVVAGVGALHDQRVRSTAILDDGQLRVSKVSRHALRLAGRVHPGNRARLLTVLTDAAANGRRTIDTASLRQIDPESLRAILTSGLGLHIRRPNPTVRLLARRLAAQMESSRPADTRARTGTAIPGQTTSTVVTNLIWRTFGHTRPDRAESVLDWAGLLGNPAGSVAEIAHRHDIASGTLVNRIKQITSRGAQTPLTPLQLSDANRETQPTEDSLGRERIAKLLGLPPPGQR